MGHESLNEACQGDHGFFTDPATDITSPIELVVIECGEHRIKRTLKMLRFGTLHAQGHDYIHQ